MELEDRVLRRLKLRELRILSAVAKAGSMGKAARQLALSQPAVSKAIAELEHTVGFALLDRTPQGIAPTVYGRTMLKWATAVFDDLSQSVREIESLADPTRGEVRVGCHEVMSAGLLPAVIDRLSRRSPRVVFTVKQGATLPSLYEDLRDRRVDLIFGRMITPAGQEDLSEEVLFDDPLVIVAGARSKWLRRRKIDLGELVEEAWCLVPDDLPIAPFVAQAFRSRGLEPPRVVVRANAPHLFYAMARTGRFLTVAETSTLRLSGRRLGLRPLPIKLTIQPGPVGIVTSANRMLTPVAQRFVDCAREICGPLAKYG